MEDVRGLYGGYINLNFGNVAGNKVLVVDTPYNYGDSTEVELGVNEIDELIKQLREAKKILSDKKDKEEDDLW
ncbi:hypothetical protein [Bacillus thuringiensis]|uniref:hypothetical protein n=1 Tax=Bacillus thuringiensis TaxID=1428 RepID=UPI00159C5DB4|nr:hypothetical protein [Bacillus thuringiensis]